MNQLSAAKSDGAAVSSAFWDALYTTNPSYSKELVEEARLAIHAAADWAGGFAGKTVIDLGCGGGASSLLLADLGAEVIALDASQVAVDHLAARCRSLGVDRVHPRLCNAITIDSLGPVDFVYGAMILHHIEPFADFAAALRRTIRPGGRAFFFENNAASELLIWFRQNVVGKLWVPKYGDEDEFPLMPSEIDVLRRHFDVRVDWPRMEFFGLVPMYLLRDRFAAPFQAFDRFLFRHRIGLKYSYQQYLYLQG